MKWSYLIVLLLSLPGVLAGNFYDNTDFNPDGTTDDTYNDWTNQDLPSDMSQFTNDDWSVYLNGHGAGITPEVSTVLSSALENDPTILQEVNPENVDNLGNEIIDDHNAGLTDEQVQAIGDAVLQQLKPQTIQELLSVMTPDQLSQLVEGQVTELTGDQLEEMYQKFQDGSLTDEDIAQIAQYLTEDQIEELFSEGVQSLGDLYPSLLDEYTDTINGGLTVEGEYGTIEDGNLVVNDIPLSLEESFSEGSWNVATKETGFDITSQSEFNQLSFMNPITGDPLETILGEGQSLSLELIEGSIFSVRLNDNFLNLDIVPEGPARMRFYSKVEDSTLQISKEGQYTFENGVLTYDNLEYRETLDTESIASVDIDMKVGFICTQCNKNDIYKYESKVTGESVSLKMSLDNYKSCIRKNEYIQDDYYQTVMQFEQLNGNRKFSYVNLPDDYTWLGSWVEMYKNDNFVYQSRGRFGTHFTQGAIDITAPAPEKTVVTGPFTIWEEVNARFLRVSASPQSDLVMTTYTTKNGPPAAIVDSAFVQTSPTNTVTAYAVGSTAAQEYVDVLVSEMN